MGGNTIYDMPIELLGRIFHLLCFELDVLELNNMRYLNEFPWAVGLVCKTWRDAFLSFPALWASLALVEVGEVYSAAYHDEVIRRLAVYLRRSGEYPLTICVYRHPSPKAWKMLLSQSHRWKDANLHISIKEQAVDLQAHSKRMPLLEKLAIHHEYHLQECYGILEHAPRLCTASLQHRGGINCWILPWSQLSKLSLFLRAAGSTLAEPILDGKGNSILHMLENVEELSITNELAGLSQIDFPSTPACLRSLHTLTISHPLLLSLLKAPMLHELRLDPNYHERDISFAEDLSSFFHRSSCKLRRLIFSHVHDAQRVMSICPHVEELQIYYTWTTTGINALKNALSGLDDHGYIPRLRILALIPRYYAANVMILPPVEALSNLLRSRTQNSKSDDTVSFPSPSLLEKVMLNVKFPPNVPIPVQLLEAIERWPSILSVTVRP